MMRRLHAGSTRQLLTALNASSDNPSQKYTASAIRRVLRQRGLTDAAITRLGEAERERATTASEAADAPTTENVILGDSSQQLRRMALDASPRVRRRALTMLATANDANLQEIARDRAVNDVDPQVVEIASGILEQFVR